MLTWKGLVSDCVWVMQDQIAGQVGCAYNEFDGISKGGVQEAPEGLSEWNGEFFGRKGEEGGQRDDGDKIEAELGDWRPVEDAGEDSDGDEDQEDVDVVCLQDLPGGV